PASEDAIRLTEPPSLSAGDSTHWGHMPSNSPRTSRASSPAVVRGLAAALCYLRLVRDPLQATTYICRAYGPFVKFPYPRGRGSHGQAVIIAIGADFNRQVLGDPETWCPVKVGPLGPKNGSVGRLASDILGMSGRRHEHYRRLLLPRLQK